MTPRRTRPAGRWFHLDLHGAIYVGRALGGLKGSPYANPHTTSDQGCKLCDGQVHTNPEAVELYRQHLRDHPELVERARLELAGRDLACWCKPHEACHADALLAVAAGATA